MEQDILVVIPDVHHDWDWVEAIVKTYGPNAEYVFLGDYFDYKKNRTYNHLESLALLKHWVVVLGERATWLIGNHDLQYHPLNKQFGGSLTGSGYSRADAEVLEGEVPWERLQAAHADSGFLFTHAGLGIFKELEGIDNPQALANQLNQDFENVDSGIATMYLFGIGSGSGGLAVDGGPFWHRLEEGPLAYVNQMVGHTMQKKPRRYAVESQPDVQHWYVDSMQSSWIEINKKTQVVTPRSFT